MDFLTDDLTDDLVDDLVDDFVPPGLASPGGDSDCVLIDNLVGVVFVPPGLASPGD